MSQACDGNIEIGDVHFWLTEYSKVRNDHQQHISLDSHEADRRLLHYDLRHGSRHALLVSPSGYLPGLLQPAAKLHLFPHRQLLQVIKEILPSGARLRLNIDATSRGNISRFFNHRCT